MTTSISNVLFAAENVSGHAAACIRTHLST